MLTGDWLLLYLKGEGMHIKFSARELGKTPPSYCKCAPRPPPPPCGRSPSPAPLRSAGEDEEARRARFPARSVSLGRRGKQQRAPFSSFRQKTAAWGRMKMRRVALHPFGMGRCSSSSPAERSGAGEGDRPQGGGGGRPARTSPHFYQPLVSATFCAYNSPSGEGGARTTPGATRLVGRRRQPRQALGAKSMHHRHFPTNCQVISYQRYPRRSRPDEVSRFKRARSRVHPNGAA
jgi:hypothetical protein